MTKWLPFFLLFFFPSLRAEEGYPSFHLEGAPYLTICSGKGRSYSDGFESIEYVASVGDKRNFSALFVDIKGIRVEPGKMATNAGIGLRTTFFGLLGLNAFYDTRYECKNYFHQFGLGGEWLNTFFHIRCNGYLPIGKKIHTKKSGYYYFDDDYNVFMTDERHALKGMDLEIGKEIVGNPLFFIYSGCGPYHFEQFDESGTLKISGIQARVNAVILDHLCLEFFYTYDSFFKGRPLFLCELTIPFGTIGNGINRFLFPVRRNPIITLNGSCSYTPNY